VPFATLNVAKVPFAAWLAGQPVPRRGEEYSFPAGFIIPRA